ncbi:BID domain-containing protein [Xanthobacter sp. V13C-7B]|uniref:BID domain-containing protein n=1 Tax=Xanthobacter variabilis TaxID=3119932 RepID=UPI00372AC93A
MFAAVTSFAESVEQVAERRAWARADVVASVKELAAEAGKVWSEPERAVAAIRTRIEGGTTTPAALREDITRDPETFGTLRGSGRLLDRFGAAGAERKRALDAAAFTAIVAGTLLDDVVNYRTVESTAEREHRKRMAIEVPGLSESAAQALTALKATKEHGARQQLVSRMPLAVRTEIAQTDQALRARFGTYENATLEALHQRVPEDQRARLDAARADMLAAHAVMRIGSTMKHEQERLQRQHSRGITPQR